MVNIQAQMKELFGNSCCGYCYAYIAHKQTCVEMEPSIKLLTATFLEGWVKGYIDDDGFVSKPVPYYNNITAAPKIKDIVKHDILSFADLPKKGMYTVEMRLTRESKEKHFVVATRKDGIIFDPSGNSITWQYGVVISYRELIYA